MTKIKRNDPCLCGSGKKYKRCCLQKEEQQRREQVIKEQQEQQANSFEDDYCNEYLQDEHCEDDEDFDDNADEENGNKHDRCEDRKFWDEFAKKDYTQRVDIFKEKLDDEEWLDSEVAFDMLDGIYVKAMQDKNYSKFCDAINTFQTKHPDMYEESAFYYLTWEIQSAIIEQNWTVATPKMIKLSQMADKEIELYESIIDALKYYGQTSILAQAWKIAWPTIENSPHITPLGIEQLNDDLINCLIFQHLEQENAPKIDDLLEEISSYAEVEKDKLINFVTQLTQRVEQKWSIQDFQFSKSKKKSKKEKEKINKQAKQNLKRLCIEFLKYLHKEKDISYLKADMACRGIQSYVLDCQSGKLKNLPHNKQHDNILCPNAKTMDTFLVRYLEMFVFQPYVAAAIMELLPQWLLFLKKKDLLDENLLQKTIASCDKLKNNLIEILRRQLGDATVENQILQKWQF